MNSYLRLQFEIQIKNAQALAGVKRDIDGIGAKAGAAGKAGQGFNDFLKQGFTNLGNFGKNLQWTGRQLEFNFTMPIVRAGTAIFELANANEQAVTRITKVFQGAGDGTERLSSKMLVLGESLGRLPDNMSKVDQQSYSLGKNFRLLSDYFGMSINDVADLGAEWSAAGGGLADIAAGTRLTIEAMKIGDFSSTEEAFQTIIQLQQAYGLSLGQTREALALLNKVENVTPANFADLAVALARAGGAANTVGVDIQHLAAFTAALVPATGSAASAGNALKTMLSKMMAPTKDAVEVMGLLGVQFDETAFQSQNAVGRLGMLADAMKQATPAQRSYAASVIYGRYQLNRADVLLTQIADSQSTYNSVLDETSGAATGTADAIKGMDDEISILLKSTPQGIEIMKTRIQNAAMSIAGQLMPAVLGVLTQIQNLVAWFGKLDPRIQQMAMMGVVFLAAVGPIVRVSGAVTQLISLFGKVALGVAELPATIVKAFSSFFGVISRIANSWLNVFVTANRVFKGITSGVGTMAGFVGDAFMALAGFANRVLLKMGLDVVAYAGRFKTELGALGQAFSTFASTMGSIFTGSLKALFGPLGALINANVLTPIRSAMSFVADVVTHTLGIALNVVVAQAKAIGDRVLNAINTAASAVWSFTKTAVSAVGGFFTALPSMIGKFTTAAYVHVSSFFMNLGSIALRGVDFMANAVFNGLEAIIGVVQNLPAALSGAWQWIVTSAQRAFIAMQTLMSAAWSSMVGFVQGIPAALSSAWTWVVNGAKSAMTVMADVVFGAFEAIISGLQAIPAIVSSVTGFMATIPAAIGSALSAVWAAIVAGATALPGIIGGIVPAMEAVGTAIWTAMTGPVGIIIFAVSALGAVFYAFRDQIFDALGGVASWVGGMFSSIGSTIAGVFSKLFGFLPDGVQKAFMAVVQIVANAMKQVIEWLSYLNPFARHSPSLVDNVIAGVAVIGAQYRSLNNIGNIYRAATDHMKEFAAVTADANAAVLAGERADQRASVATLAPQAIPALDQLFGDQDTLKATMGDLTNVIAGQQAKVDQLQAAYDDLDRQVDAANAVLKTQKDVADSLKTSLDAAEARLKSFADTPIAGMKAMNDQIWSNDMAQKRLQLDMMAMEDTLGPIDEVQNRMAALQGDIEKLTGMQSDLRAAGAGSEITGPIQDQIDALNAQKVAVEDQAKPLQDMKNQLAALQREGQRLDLEKSVQFDPLTKQIQDATTAMNELPFDQIMAGITSSKADVDSLTAAYNQANATVAQQQAVVDQLTTARDAAKVPLDNEKKSLDDLNTAYSALKSQYDDITQAIGDMTRAADAAIAKQKKLAEDGPTQNALNFEASAAGDFPITSGIDPSADLPDIDAQNAEMQAKLDQMGKMDMFGPFKEMWGQFKGWWDKTVGPIVSEAWDKVKGWMQEGWGKVSDVVQGDNFQDKLTGVGDSIRDFGSKAADLFDKIANNPLIKWFLDTVEHLGRTVASTAKIIIDGLVALGKAIGEHFAQWQPLLVPALEAVRNVAAVVAAVALAILGALYTVYAYLLNVFQPIIKAVFGFLVEFIGPVIDFLRGVFEIIIGLLTGRWSMAWQGVKDIFAAVWDGVVAILRGAINLILGALNALYQAFMRPFRAIASAISGVIKTIWHWLSYLNPWAEHSPSLVSQVESGLAAIVGFFLDLPMKLLRALGDLGQMLWDAIVGAIKWLFTDGVQYYLELLRLEFVVLPQKIWEALGDLGSWLWSMLKAGFDVLRDAVGAILDAVIGFFRDLPGNIWTAVGDLGRWLWDHLVDGMNWLHDREWDIIDSIIGFFRDFPGKIWSALGDVGRWLWDKVKAGWDFYKSSYSTILQGVVGFFRDLPGNIWNAMGDLGYWIWDKIKNGFFDLKNAISGIVDDVVGFFRDLPGKIGNLVTDIYNAFSGLGGKIKDGILNGVGAALDFAKGMANALVGFINDRVIGSLESGVNSAIDKWNSVPFLPDAPHVGFPRIPSFHEGGVVPGRSGQDVLALLRAGELVLSLADVERLGDFTSVGNSRQEPGAPQPTTTTRNLTFTGDLVLPNIKSGDDANEFIRNLEALAVQ